MAGQSTLQDFLAFLTTVRGDLANITAPPYFLASRSVTELGTCWTERPSLFLAPALESNAHERMRLVLKWFLAALRNLFYADGNVNASIKKPLNAFLGELFIASWSDANGHTSQLVSEQVSHHPPVTALHMWNEQYGIWGTGYSRVEMTFAGSISVKTVGYAHLHIDRYDEDYIVPLLDFKVKGFFSGMLYPEPAGTYHIVSSSGLTSEINFEGKSFWGSGTKNGFTAVVYNTYDVGKTSLYTAQGSWSNVFTFYKAGSQLAIDTWDTNMPTSVPDLPDLSEQDPWETRKAWQHVLSALKSGNLSTAVAEKSKVEEAQRAMRRREKAGQAKPIEPLFFAPQTEIDATFEALAKGTGWKIYPERTKGVWKYVGPKSKMERPFREDSTPIG